MSKFTFTSPKHDIPVGIYMFKVNNKNTKTRYEICSKLKSGWDWLPFLAFSILQFAW